MKNGKKRGGKTIAVRPVTAFALLCAAFFGLVLRLAFLQADPAAAAGAADTRYVKLGESRGCIYDRRMRRLVNDTFTYENAVVVRAETADLLARTLGQARAAVPGTCVTFSSDAPIGDSVWCRSVRLVRRSGERQLAAHMIGYTDADGRGVCGIEKAFDRILADASGEIGVRYTVNGLGLAIAGEGLQVENDGYDGAAGVVLTLDRDIQRVTEDAMLAAGVEKGAAVVLDVSSGAVLAAVSLPAYDRADMAASLRDPDLPFLNRALEAYPVGSVFKPFAAVAAVENGVSVNGDFVCTGSIRAGDVTFGCYRRRAHGPEDLNAAICNSCNTYFVDLTRRLGADALLETAAAFGFGTETELTGTLRGAAGNLPDAAALKSPAALANLSFGQGALLATPLQLAAAYAALADGGLYRTPFLLKALVDGEGAVYAEYRNSPAVRAADAGVCAVVGEALRRNMTEGTGVNGRPTSVTAAGKTATAQTGTYADGGAERLCTWFCGYFPFEDPRYAVAILNEDGAAAAVDCAPVFRAIADGVAGK